jgi:hypothetical protein
MVLKHFESTDARHPDSRSHILWNTHPSNKRYIHFGWPRREIDVSPNRSIRNGFVPDAAQTRLSLLRLAIQIDGISPRRRARSLPILLDLCPGHTLLWIYANLVAEPLDPPFAIA